MNRARQAMAQGATITSGCITVVSLFIALLGLFYVFVQLIGPF